MKKAFSLVAVFLLVASCGAKKDYGLSIEITPSNSYALSSAIFSCKQIAGINGASTSSAAAVGSYRLQLGRPVITWKKTGTTYLAVDQVIVSFQHANLGGTYNFGGIDADEFLGIIVGSAGVASAPAGFDTTLNMFIPATSDATPNVVQAGCEVRVGSLPITASAGSFKGTGTFKILGRAVDVVGGKTVSETPVFAETKISFDYIKF